MTAVFLEIIALVGLIIFGLITKSIVKSVINNNPKHMSLFCAYGKFDIEFDTRADE